MKHYLILLLLVTIFIFTGCRTRKPAMTEQPAGPDPAEQQAIKRQMRFSEQSTWLLGYFSLNRFLQAPYSEWYMQEYDDYQPDSQYIEKLKEAVREDLSIKIVLGTWCPDSRREVPRFMRIINMIGFPAERIEFIGVDDVKNSPIENYDALGIERVPTFIFYRNKVETGRIIETPTTSLEQDMYDILTRNEK